MKENTLENNNIRTMELIGVDFWSRPVFKCIETGILYKDLTLGSENPDLYGCGNDFDGEPDFPINKGLEIRFKEMPKQVSREDEFNYQLLGRLKSDCEYFLGYGNRNVNRLWAGNVEDQIEKMKELHNNFSENGKPEWLTYDQITQYEKLMINNKQSERTESN